MVVHTRQSAKAMPPSKSPSRRPKLPMMHAKGCYTPAPPNQTSYWRRRKAAALAEEIRDLQDNIMLHSTSETSGAPSCAKDGPTQAHSSGRKNATSLKGATSRRHVLVNARKRREISTTQKQSRSQGGSQD